MSFSTPAWLFGLLLVPVIWYLHRTGPILRRHPVASLDLWRDARLEAMQAGDRRRADPAWIRRAIIAASLSLALAGPTLPRGGERVTLWVDDSLSMQTRQSGRTRLERGLDLAATALRASGVHDVETRVLSSPMRVGAGLGPSDRGTITSQAGRHEPRLPDPAQIDRSRSHWLLTDGADASVNAWLAAAPVARVFQVADDSRNVGIARLSARPQPADATALAIQVQLTNAGDRAESRRVVVTTDAGVIGERDVSIEPGSTATIPFDCPGASAQRGGSGFARRRAGRGRHGCGGHVFTGARCDRRGPDLSGRRAPCDSRTPCAARFKRSRCTARRGLRRRDVGESRPAAHSRGERRLGSD